jgi:hypothetical protein
MGEISTDNKVTVVSVRLYLGPTLLWTGKDAVERAPIRVSMIEHGALLAPFNYSGVARKVQIPGPG